MKKSITAFLVIGLLAGIIPDTGVSAKVNHYRFNDYPDENTDTKTSCKAGRTTDCKTGRPTKHEYDA